MIGDTVRRRLVPLAHRDLRLFFAGEAASLLGSAMASLALSFAVLGAGGSGRELGLVMAARILPMVVLMPAGGVLADRLGPRRMMVAGDLIRCLGQAALAVALMSGRPPTVVFAVLAVISGTGEACYLPARGAVVPRVAAAGRQYEGKLQDANALGGLAQSLATVSGPALAGLAVAAAGPGPVIALDAATYAFSAIMLARLAVDDSPAASGGGSEAAALRAGWREFRSRGWLWVSTLQFTLFNMLVWAPFLVLGPVVAHDRLGGALDWGIIMACYGAGSVAGGLALVGGRRAWRRPLAVATFATLGWALPSAALAAGLPVPLVGAAALVAGVGAAVSGALYAMVNQRHLPAAVLARVTSFTAVGAFALGPAGLAAAGPAADLAGAGPVLAFGAAWQAVTALLVLALPAIRRLPLAPDTAPAPEPAPAAGRTGRT
ncbi:MFS transporter [Sphaerisporangium rufum]|uniref:MFS transporter n=1 Tax=Sphaerisporangium rufum TaxID=1381558 RepID=UPI0019522CD6|nr:MFS transporter [Sphaerisporangium rufum]